MPKHNSRACLIRRHASGRRCSPSTSVLGKALESLSVKVLEPELEPDLAPVLESPLGLDSALASVSDWGSNRRRRDSLATRGQRLSAHAPDRQCAPPCPRFGRQSYRFASSDTARATAPLQQQRAALPSKCHSTCRIARPEQCS